MLHRILSPAVFLALFTLASPRPASAQFDVGSWIQRATIIANQIRQISHQVSQIRSMARQLTELEDQLDHMERAARGEIDALLAPFSRLAAEPVGLVRDGLSWGSDFQGAARETVAAVRGFGTRRPLVQRLWAERPRRGRPGERGRHPRAVPRPAARGRHPRGRGLPPRPRSRRPAAGARLRDARRGVRARRDHRERAGLVRRTDRERQPVQSAPKSLSLLAHCLAEF